MTGDWPRVRLGEVLRRSEIAVRPDPKQEYSEITVRLWGNGVVERGKIGGASLAGSRRFVARAGQLIISRIDARNGAIGIVPALLDGALVSNDFPLFDTDNQRMDAHYLGWLSRTADFVQLCRAASEGTTNRVRLKEDRFLSLEIALPPLAEQQRIVDRVKALVEQIEEAQKLRGESSEAMEHLVASTHASLAKSRKRALGDVLRLDEDAVAVTPDGQYPQVGLRSFGAGLFTKSATSGTETSYRTFNRLFSGAVVLSQVKGWEGAVAVCPSELAGWFVSPEYRTFRCIDGESSPGYFAELVRTEWFWSQLGSATRGVGARRERTRPEQFLAIEMPIPDYEQQLLAERWFSELHPLRHLHADTAAELDALLPAVLSKAFRGELL